MKFLDANIIVYACTNSSRKKECLSLLLSEELLTDGLVLVETFAVIARISTVSDASDSIRLVQKLGNIKVVPLDQNLIFEAIKRIKRLSLSISDLIHATAAELHGCTAITSYDSDFDVCEIPREEP